MHLKLKVKKNKGVKKREFKRLLPVKIITGPWQSGQG